MVNLDILAGKMAFDGKKVSPDNRKGILRLLIDPDADIVKVQWLDRSQEPAVVELELLAPVTIEPVPSVKTGRVFVLKQEPSGEKNFVWIQQQASGNAAGDAAGLASGSVDNVESLINQIQMFAQMRSGKEAAEVYAQIFEDEVRDDQMLIDLGHHHQEHDEEEEADEEELQALMEQLVGEGELSRDQIAQLLITSPEIQQALVAQFVLMAANFVALNPAFSQAPSSQPLEVKEVVQSEKSVAILTSDSEIEKRLLALCPEGETDLKAVIRSPQFGEALRNLTEGIYSEQISVLFASLGLDQTEIAHHTDPFEALCNALEKKFRKL